jgi:hypothetical protein
VVSLGRTFLLLYACIYNSLTIKTLPPHNGTGAASHANRKKRGAEQAAPHKIRFVLAR